MYKVKRDVEGKVSRFKARWVIKGYLQQFGVDFDQTYASVVKPMAFRTLFALAAFFDLDIDQMDVKTAFLYGLIDQLIYMEIPKGTETEATKNMVCKLLKAIYGLKQSPRLWYERFSAFLLEKLGLKRIHADHSIFVSGAGLKGLRSPARVNFSNSNAGATRKDRQPRKHSMDIGSCGSSRYRSGGSRSQSSNVVCSSSSRTTTANSTHLPGAQKDGP